MLKNYSELFTRHFWPRRTRWKPSSLGQEEFEDLQLKLRRKLDEVSQNAKVARASKAVNEARDSKKVDAPGQNGTKPSFSLSSYLSWPGKTQAPQKEPSQAVTKKALSKPQIDKITLSLVSNLRSTYSGTDPWYIKRLEELCQHLQEYPESKGVFVRQEAIGSVLNILKKSQGNLATELQAREALANLGYNYPLRGRGIRILSIDGGGMRGIVACQMLRSIEEQTCKPIHELFDFICGVSTGAILASFLGFHKKSIDEIEEIYKKIGSKIFTQSILEGTKGWVTSHSYYNTKLYEEVLQNFVGELPMRGLSRSLGSTPKVAIVSSLVCEQRISPFVFRSYELPFRVHSSFKGSNVYPVWAAVRASSAAPGYFDEFLLDDKIHHDGGLLTNNATHVAIHEARRLWPSEKVHCVISLGLGRNEFPIESSQSSKSLSLAQKFSRIIDSATDTELVHETLNDNLDSKVYYRFNPYLPEYLPLDEKRPAKMALMAESANMYIRRNQSKMKEACRRLAEPRSFLDQALDYMSCQREIVKSKLMKIA